MALALAVAGAPALAQPAATTQQRADKALQFAQQGDLKSAESELRKAVDLPPSDPSLLTSPGHPRHGGQTPGGEYVPSAGCKVESARPRLAPQSCSQRLATGTAQVRAELHWPAREVQAVAGLSTRRYHSIIEPR